MLIKVGLFGYSKEDKLKKIWHILHAQLFGFYLYIENKQYSDHFLVTDEVSLRNRSLNERISDKSVMLFEYKTDAQEYIDSFQSGKGDKDVTTIGLSAYNLVYNIETLIDLVTRVEIERNQKTSSIIMKVVSIFYQISPKKSTWKIELW